MPNNVVRTPEQEEMWSKAKKIAQDAGQKDNYSYIMGIYKKMGGLKKNSAEWDDATEKLAAGYLSKLLGTNIGAKNKEVVNLTKKLARKKRLMKNWTVKKKGFLGLGKEKVRPKFSAADISGATSGLKSQLGSAKESLKNAQKETYKTRRNTLIGAGLTGAGIYGAKKKIDSYNQQNYRTASENDSNIEKEASVKQIADAIVNNVKKVKNFKINPKNIKKGLKDSATFKDYRALRKDFKKLKPDGNDIGESFSSPEFHTISNSRYNMKSYKDKAEKAEKILNNLTPNEKNIDKIDNMVAAHDNNVEITKDIFKSREPRDAYDLLAKDRNGRPVSPMPKNPVSSKKWHDTTQRFENERDFYNKAHDAHKAIHDKTYAEALRKKDIALSKGLGLYGGVGIAGYGTYKAIKKKQSNK